MWLQYCYRINKAVVLLEVQTRSKHSKYTIEKKCMGVNVPCHLRVWGTGLVATIFTLISLLKLNNVLLVPMAKGR